jgi:hypothetical protein
MIVGEEHPHPPHVRLEVIRELRKTGLDAHFFESGD